MIDPAANNKVTELGSATRMCATDDILYLTYSNYTNPTASFFTYNIKTGKMDEASFLKDIPEKLKTSTIYMLEVMIITVISILVLLNIPRTAPFIVSRKTVPL